VFLGCKVYGSQDGAFLLRRSLTGAVSVAAQDVAGTQPNMDIADIAASKARTST